MKSRFSEDAKRKIVAYSYDAGVAAAASEYGVTSRTIYAWRSGFKPGKRPDIAATLSEKPLMAVKPKGELSRLQEENDLLSKENKKLKKALSKLLLKKALKEV